MINLKLNAEQEKMFVENQKLIHAAIHKYMPHGNLNNTSEEYEDLFQIGSLALCKAIKTYNSTKFAFSTYATTVIRNELYNASKAKKDATSKSEYSINDETSNAEEIAVPDETNQIINNIVYNEQVNVLLDIANEYNGVTKKGIWAIILVSQQYSCSEIAKMFHTTPKNVTAWISRARKRIKENPRVLEIFER